MNITKLAVWPKLQALGFEVIKYKAHGRTVATGAALRQTLTDINGKEFKTDLIEIEPNGGKYHITGDYKTPFYGTFFRYEFGRKVELYEQVTHCNKHFTAREIEAQIEKMLS